MTVRRERDDRDVDVARRVDLRVDESIACGDRRGRGDRDGLAERLTAVARDRHADLCAAAIAVEHRPRRVDVVLVAVARDVIDRDPLLVFDVARLLRRGVVGGLERLAAVALHPRAAEVVAV